MVGYFKTTRTTLEKRNWTGISKRIVYRAEGDKMRLFIAIVSQKTQ